ncbi:hypothetical protein C8Q70DRAFT_1056599 [Cubamyces menziesii]|nr:hypothetical protein C8Q70DRAFT_1056599 [Cubamyces menziesii]
MSGTDEPEPDLNTPTTELNTTQPHNRLAAKHTDCPCNIDPRCQLAVAFQGAREYWASHPNDIANGPNEIHESIEKWLVAKRILEGPSQITLKIPRMRQETPPLEALPSLSPLARLPAPGFPDSGSDA